MSDLAPEGAPVEPVAEEAPAAEQPWAPDPAEWEATQQRLAELQQVVQPQPQWQPQPQGPPIPDPFSENYAEQFQQYTEHLMAPYQQFQQQLQLAEAEERGMEILSEHAQTLGEFDRDMAWARANMLTYQGVDVHKALEQAAKETREYERRVGEAYHQQQIEQFQGLGQVRREPGQSGQTGAASQLISVNGPGDESAVLHKYFRTN